MFMGSYTSPHAFPWIVRIEINDGSDGNFCGGSIIDRKWVLTGNGKMMSLLNVLRVYLKKCLSFRMSSLDHRI